MPLQKKKKKIQLLLCFTDESKIQSVKLKGEIIMTDREFDNLIQVVTYDDWIVSTDNNGKILCKR